MDLSRRTMLGVVGAGIAMAGVAGGTRAGAASLTADAQPISRAERQGRLEKLRDLMGRQGVGALIVEPGSSLEYFTGVKWHRSERTTAAVIPAHGEVVIVTPFFEEPSVRETLEVAADVRPWNEHESPFARLAQALTDRGAGSGVVAVEATTRFFIVDALRAALPAASFASGEALVRACRMVKSPAELALMQAANNVTLAALKRTHKKTELSMTAADIARIMEAATLELGGHGVEFTLVLLNAASAYPHGSHRPEIVLDHSVVLMDCGCNLFGYQSDISRTWVFGEPSPRQRKVWATVKRGQEIALETAKIGAPVGTIDDAVRGYYEAEGWGPGYRLPGLSHRTGHGIGMDGHEAPYLVHGDATPLAAGMCFSDEPGLYIPGAFGVRLEDCWHMTETGPKLFTPLAKSIDDPI